MLHYAAHRAAKGMAVALLMVVCTSGNANAVDKTRAFVTLATTSGNGYSVGVVALGQSLRDPALGRSRVSKVVMVTPEVSKEDRVSFQSVGWEIEEVEPLACRISKQGDDANSFSKTQPAQVDGRSRWHNSCTKFRAWGLVRFERVLFMDADTVVVAPIDDLLYGSHSNASFAAAPESNPPDTFNAGVMLIRPSTAAMERLLQINEEMGSIEGGDQTILNRGLCPNWYSAGATDPDCGRIPYRYNVIAAHYTMYLQLQNSAGEPPPAVIHFVNDGKPWSILQLEYLPARELEAASPMLMRTVGQQAIAHMMWRNAYFRALGQQTPDPKFLQKCLDSAQKPMFSGIGGSNKKEKKHQSAASDDL